VGGVRGDGLDLLCGQEPLDRPRDRALAERVVANRALVRATDGAGLDVDLTLVMAGFDFDTVWAERRVFRVGAGYLAARVVKRRRRAWAATAWGTFFDFAMFRTSRSSSVESWRSATGSTVFGLVVRPSRTW
jgi:hypothetical protein